MVRKADEARRTGQSVARISEELGHPRDHPLTNGGRDVAVDLQGRWCCRHRSEGPSALSAARQVHGGAWSRLA